VRVGPEHVGLRVVLRQALADGRATDVLGELLAWDSPPGYARVATRHGEVSVPLADILLGKPVPPEPARVRRRRLGVAEIQEVMADGWQPLEREDYGGWRLRAAEGFTGRANSVLPLGDPPAPLPAAIDHVEAWYDARGLPARFAVPWPLGAGPEEPGYGADPLEAELVSRGYRLDTPTLVMVRALRGHSPDVAPTPDLAIDVRESPDEGFLTLYRYRGQDLPPVAARVMVSAPAQAFVSVRTLGTGRTVAVGRVASSRGWSGISAVEVAEDHRRRGLAALVMSTLHAWGRERGDHSAYLQVARANVAGRALYDGLGYVAHSGYHYRIRS
jgi:N-acetylglutamate synthase